MYAIVSLVLVALLAGTTEANPIDFPPLGGWSEIGTNDQDVQEAAAFAASELNLNLVDVISAQSQVVAGTNFKLVLSLGSGCLLNECTVVVWAKLDGTKELSTKECAW